MTDRELLELAAKAAGISVYESTDGTIQNRPVLVFSAGGGMGTMPYEERWNPLSDDAQVFRLAVKLDIDIYQADNDEPSVYAGYWHKRERRDVNRIFCIEPIGKDPYAATRRAIVRAAAEVGKQMGGSDD